MSDEKNKRYLVVAEGNSYWFSNQKEAKDFAKGVASRLTPNVTLTKYVYGRDGITRTYPIMKLKFNEETLKIERVNP